MRSWLPATKDGLDAVVQGVLRMARTCGCSRSRQTDLAIAAREALANAIIHGNANDPDRKIFVRCYGEPETGILIAIRDQGPGFDPANVPDPRLAERRHLPHGRGLLLMRELADHVEHRKGGREVLLFCSCRATTRAAAPRDQGRSR